MIPTNKLMASMNMIRWEEGPIVVEINLNVIVFGNLEETPSTHNKFKTMPNGKQEPPHNNQHPQPSRPKE
jgi:hypothetical protein